jgi:hypothetical protein
VTAHLSNNINHFYVYMIYFGGLDCQGTRLRTGRCGIWTLEGLRSIFLFKNIQTSSGVHPASYSMCTWNLSSTRIA